jgi:hypothetical protein
MDEGPVMNLPAAETFKVWFKEDVDELQYEEVKGLE